MKKIFWVLLFFSLFIGIRNVDAEVCTYYYDCKVIGGFYNCKEASINLSPPNNPFNGQFSSCSQVPSTVYMNSTGAFCTSELLCGSNAIKLLKTKPTDPISQGPSGGSSGGSSGGGTGNTTLPDDGEDIEHDLTGEGENYLNNESLKYKSCGDLDKIPEQIPTLTSFAYNALKVLTPVVLIIIGAVDLMKSIMAGKEDAISKAQSSLVKKLVIAGLVFLIASIVQYVVKFTAKAEDANGVIACMSCFLNDQC